MDIKMVANTQLSTTESKKQKLSKQIEQDRNYRYGDQLEGYLWGERKRRMVQG